MPQSDAPADARLAANGPAARAGTGRPSPMRRTRAGSYGNLHPGSLERPWFGLRLDRPVADSGQVEDWQLQDEHNEQKLDHAGSVSEPARGVCKASYPSSAS